MAVGPNLMLVMLSVIGVGATLYVAGRIFKWWKRNYRWTKVGTISQLMIHPIKSCRALVVSAAECTPLGLRNAGNSDRKLMAISMETMDTITAREAPKLVLLEPFVDEDQLLSIFVDGVEGITVDLHKVERDAVKLKSTLWTSKTEGFDCGEEVSNWISDCLGRRRGDLRLIYMGKSLPSRLVTSDMEFGHFFRRTDRVGYGDCTPYMLMNENSLNELNSRFSDTNDMVSVRNFRPNIVIQPITSKAFDEDNWCRIRIGNDVIMRSGKPCHRCIQTTINPETAKKHPRAEPLRSLRKFRLCNTEDKHLYGYSPLMGINLAIDTCGPISVGDPVFASYRG